MTQAAGQERVIHVGIAEGNVGRVPDKLRTTGLGSCIGLVLYDMEAGVAGLVHVMLPSAPEHATNVAKYADLAVPWLLERVCECGAKRPKVRAKLAGGAQMFATVGKSDIMRVGPRNC
jgi:chemotaxis protein CheD